MKQKPITPYARLLDEFKKFCDDIYYRKRKAMFKYPFKRLNENWDMRQVWERVQAAKQLGYTVELEADAEYLTFVFVKDVPSRPWVTQ